jgi:SHO1 osmosensor
LGLSAIAWIIAFIGQIAAEAESRRQRTLWFAIFLQLFLILGIAFVVITDSISSNHFQLSTFLAVALVFSVIGIDQGIYDGNGAQDAVTAGWFILTIINIIWLLFFTSAEDSTVYRMLNGFGNGRLGGPGSGIGRSGGSNSRANGGASVSNANGYGNAYQGSSQVAGGGGYQSTYGQGPSAADVTTNAQRTGYEGPGSVRSAHTNTLPAAAPAIAGSGAVRSDYGHSSDIGRAGSPSSATNKQSALATGEGASGEPSAGYGYRARALYACEWT